MWPVREHGFTYGEGGRELERGSSQSKPGAVIGIRKKGIKEGNVSTCWPPRGSGWPRDH